MIGKKFGLLFRSVAVLLFATFSLGSWVVPSVRGAEIETIRAAVPTMAMNFMHAALARKIGIDRHEGIALETILMRVSTAMTALIAGNIDYNFAFEPQ